MNLFARKTMQIFLTACLAVVTLSMSAHAQTPASPNQPITDEEFLNLFKAGQIIESRVIQASAILRAIQIAQDAAQHNQTLPPRLEVRDSVIDGTLTSSQLRETKVRDLQPELRQRYRRYYIDGVHVVPIPIIITGSTFQGPVDLSVCVWEGLMIFTGSVFQQYASFHLSTFETSALLAAIEFRDQMSCGLCEFREEVDFGSGVFNKRADFDQATFHNRVLFDSAFHAQMSFIGAKFLGQANLSLVSDPPTGELIFSDTVFHNVVEFRGLRCSHALFDGASFRQAADFRYSEITTFISLRRTTFEEEADFFFATFPSRHEAEPAEKGLALDGVVFKKTVRLNWDQLLIQKPFWRFWGPKLKVNRGDIRTWQAMEDAFRNSGNLEGQNEAMYQRRLIEPSFRGYDSNANDLSFIFWGYGVRPLRVLGWIVVVNLIFGLTYWTQTAALKDKWKRLWFTIIFTLKTFWRFAYGYQNSTNRLFKTLTITHSILAKILILCFLNVISHVSPLLNEIFGKLVAI